MMPETCPLAQFAEDVPVPSVCALQCIDVLSPPELNPGEIARPLLSKGSANPALRTVLFEILQPDTDLQPDIGGFVAFTCSHEPDAFDALNLDKELDRLLAENGVELPDFFITYGDARQRIVELGLDMDMAIEIAASGKPWGGHIHRALVKISVEDQPDEAEVDLARRIALETLRDKKRQAGFINFAAQVHAVNNMIEQGMSVVRAVQMLGTLTKMDDTFVQ